MKYADLVHDQLNALLHMSPFVRLLGITVQHVDLESERFEFTLPMHDQLRRLADSNQLHGGAIACLADTAAAAAMAVIVSGPVPTLNLSVDYLRPAVKTSLRAVAMVRRIGVVDVEIFSERGELLAIARSTVGSMIE